MSYYEQKRKFYVEISEIVTKNKNSSVPLYIFFIKAASGYGFSHGSVLRVLKDLEAAGACTIKGELVVCHG